MLILVTALMAEARAFIDFFKLKIKSDSTYFPFYQNSDIGLIVTGIGKIAAASACSYWQGKLDLKNCAWLNVGLAGHPHLEIGSSILAHKVIDSASQNSYYPIFLSSPSQKTHSLCSVDRPETTFSENHVFDMEAFGFMQSALKSSSSELVHVYKIISDNKQTSIEFKDEAIHQLIKPHVQEIGCFAQKLKELSHDIPSTQELSIEKFTTRWHFTATQQNLLKRTFHRFLSSGKELPSIEIFSNIAKGEEVLYILEQQLQNSPLDL